MRVARISIAEFKTEEGFAAFLNDYADQFDTNFPTCEGSAMIKTGPTTLMNFIIYPNDESVADSYQVRAKFMDSRKDLLVQDETFYYEGEGSCGQSYSTQSGTNRKPKNNNRNLMQCRHRSQIYKPCFLKFYLNCHLKLWINPI